MAEIVGIETGLNIPSIDLTGFLSNSWIYVLIVAVVGVMLIVGIGLLLFYKTYNRKIIVFSQQNWLVPIKKTRGRTISLNIQGVEIIKLIGGGYVSAYGKMMGRNSYWYEKGEDGYLRNFILDKFGYVQYIEGDVRMFHAGVAKQAKNDYDNQGKKILMMNLIFLFVFLVLLVGSAWVVIGKIGKSMEPIAVSNQNQAEITEAQLKVSERLDNIVNRLGIKEEGTTGGSGLIPAG